MTFKKIFEATKTDLDDIEQRSSNFWNNLSASDVAVILKIVSIQFAAVHHLLEENGDLDQKKLLSQEQMQNIMGLFQELTNNFFPMAHTSEPVLGLRILNDRELNRLWDYQKNNIERFDQVLESMRRSVKQMSEQIMEMNNADESMRNFLQSLQFCFEEMIDQFQQVKNTNKLMWRHLNP